MSRHTDDQSLKRCAYSIRVRSTSDLVVVLVRRRGESFITFDGSSARPDETHARDAIALMREMADLGEEMLLEGVGTAA